MVLICYNCHRWLFLLVVICLVGFSPSTCSDTITGERKHNNQNERLIVMQLKRCKFHITRVLRGLVEKFSKRNPHKKTTSQFDAPRVVDDFLSSDEATQLLARYEPLLRASLEHSAQTGVRVSKYRTSRSVRLPPVGDPLVFAIEARAAAVAGFDVTHVEDFQLACYGPDQLYALHRDDAADNTQIQNRRMATVLIYLQAPTEGGSTLFTMQPLEEERDLRQKQPLRTEQDALNLFHSYCKKPKRHHVMVQAQTGRAVTWLNWRQPIQNTTQTDTTTDEAVFMKESTHGACPVIQGQKCVIQQWIAAEPLPLRRDNLLAIFPLGADRSYYPSTTSTTSTNPYQQDDSDSDTQHCFGDVSPQQGRHLLSNLCPISNSASVATTRIQILKEGPYENVGALRLISGSGWTTSLPFYTRQLDHTNEGTSAKMTIKQGVTAMFWISGTQPGWTLLSWNHVTWGHIQLRALAGYQMELSWSTAATVIPQPATSTTNAFLPKMNADDWKDWSWVVVHTSSKQVRVQMYARDGTLLGHAQLENPKQPQGPDVAGDDSCLADTDDSDDGDENPSEVQLQLFIPSTIHSSSGDSSAGDSANTTAFVSSHPPEEPAVAFATPSNKPTTANTNNNNGPSTSSVVVSFLLLYAGPLEDADAVLLRHQAKRYDIHT